jgi:hypothetical protein
MPAPFWFMIAVIVAVSMSFIAVMGWFDHKKKEREAHFRNETIRRIAESGDSSAALEFLRELQRAEALQTRSKARLAGLVTIGAGAGLMFFLAQFVVGAPVYLVGLIPVFVGVALLIFTEFMMKPKS